jgi:energy-coupling factor transport system permease protein
VLRRVSVRSALAATLSTRLVPVLAQDAQRVEEARRCRADQGGTGAGARLAVLRAVAGGALDRALDVAATLEVRGYGSARRARGRASGRPWSRHDLAFSASAAGVVALTVAGRIAGWVDYDTYPLLHGAVAGAAMAYALVVAAVALAPFAARRGIAP